jgi:C4-dicarboxylate transporter DctM subunit
MKKITAIIVCLVMVLALGACGQTTTPAATEAPAGSTEPAGTETTFEPMTWKFACSAGETSTWMEAARYFGDLISEATGGAVTVDYYPSDQLTSGSQTDGIQACMDGTTELSMHSNLIYSSFDDRFSVVSLPFLFDSTDAADAVLDGEGGDALQEVLGEYGLHCMALPRTASVMSPTASMKSRPSRHGRPCHPCGRLLRPDGSLRRMGANYTKANWSEVYTGLQTGTYDGQENPVPTMDSASIQEVQKYVTYWTGAYDCLFFVMNAELYNSSALNSRPSSMIAASRPASISAKSTAPATKRFLPAGSLRTT